MQHLTIKRIPVKNADTVRYRVYTSADEFVAVIAENALMAMKLTGITEPHKVVRDLISEEMLLPEEALDKERTEMLALTTAKVETKHEKPDLSQFTNPHLAGFTALSMGELRKAETLVEGVIASPKLLNVIDDSVPSAVKEEPVMHAEPIAVAEPVIAQYDEEISPLDVAQQALASKADLTSSEPLSAKDVVELLSPKSD